MYRISIPEHIPVSDTMGISSHSNLSFTLDNQSFDPDLDMDDETTLEKHIRLLRIQADELARRL